VEPEIVEILRNTSGEIVAAVDIDWEPYYIDRSDHLAERGLDISYETVRRWFLKFGSPIARNLTALRPTPSDH